LRDESRPRQWRDGRRDCVSKLGFQRKRR